MTPVLFGYIILLSIAWVFIVLNNFISLRKRKITPRANKGRDVVLLMVPCKGHDIDLERNLRSAINQDYRNFRPIAIVESERDAAFPAIKRSGIEYIIADYKCTKCSGKVRNLCSAISRFPEYELLCIMDSDVNAPRWWLSRLVAAMDQHTGIATSYPIFNPIGGFGSYMKHVWGFNGFSLMENSRTRFGWGGSLLFRRKLLRGDGMKRFENSISDDIALTALCKANRMKIAYVPDAAPIVDCSDTFSEFIEWSNRQTALAVYGNRKLRAYGLVAYGAQTLLLVSGIFMALFYSPVFLLFLVPFVIGLTKALRRSHKSWLSVGASYALINFIYLYNLANTFFMHSIVWRGRRYSLS